MQGVRSNGQRSKSTGFRLAGLRAGLERELTAPEAATTFERVRPGHPELLGHPTLKSMRAVLDCRIADHRSRDRLLRALVSLAQEEPREPLWKRVLLLTFLPGLVRTRMRTVEGDHDPDDVDAILWSAFFEVLQRYPLRRRGSVGAGLVRDTRKRYFRTLRDHRARRKAETDLAAYAQRTGFEFAEHQAPAVLDRDELRNALEQCTAIAAEDVQLLIATELDGMTIPEVVSTRWPIDGDERAKHREQARLCRRRRRVRARLRGALSERIRERRRGVDPVEPDRGIHEAFLAMMV